ncbi:MAG: hypothetical protein ACREM3_12750, partial [Candidatus Rokuibacteriota bacterium]
PSLADMTPMAPIEPGVDAAETCDLCYYPVRLHHPLQLSRGVDAAETREAYLMTRKSSSQVGHRP